MIKQKFLTIGIFASLAIHLIFFFFLIEAGKNPERKMYKKSYMVEIAVKAPEIKKEEPPKIEKKIEPKKIKEELPISHNKTEPAEKPAEEVKPVFGVTKESVTDNSTGIAVRIGNTVMKEQEKEYTPPEKVKDYAAGSKLVERSELKKIVPLPSYELSTLPIFKERIKPAYPESLKEEELEGEVVLTVIIDELRPLHNKSDITP